MQGLIITGVPSVRESLPLQPKLEQAGQPRSVAGIQVSGTGSMQLLWSPVFAGIL